MKNQLEVNNKKIPMKLRLRMIFTLSFILMGFSMFAAPTIAHDEGYYAHHMGMMGYGHWLYSPFSIFVFMGILLLILMIDSQNRNNTKM
jgi:uncharacterized membrane protein